MNKTRFVSWRGAIALLGMVAWQAKAVPTRSGEAMVVGQIGEASVRVFSSAIHYGRTEVLPLAKGSIVGEQSTISTGNDGQLFLIFDHGAMISLDNKSELKINHMGASSDGLPDDVSDITGLIDVELTRGSMHVQSADMSANMRMTVRTTEGVISAGPGEFIVEAGRGRGVQVGSLAGVQTVAKNSGAKVDIPAGNSYALNATDTKPAAGINAGLIRPHQMWKRLTEKTEPEAARAASVDKSALAGLLGVEPRRVARAVAPLAVSPTDPPTPTPTPTPSPEPTPEPTPTPSPEPTPEPSPQPTTKPTPVPEPSPTPQPEINIRPDPPPEPPLADPQPTPPPQDDPPPQDEQQGGEETAETESTDEEGGETAEETSGDGSRNMRPEDVFSWYNDVGVIKGVNYWTDNVENPAEMWREENFNLDRIREDFDLAKDAGYTDIRVQLNIDEWLSNPDGFLDRLTSFIDQANQSDLRFVPVLLDPLMLDRALTAGTITPDDIRDFISAIINNYKDQGDVLYWDIFAMEGIENVSPETRRILEEAAAWARQLDAGQPITVAAMPQGEDRVVTSDLTQSDLLTFRSTDPPEVIEEIIKELQRLGRPVICIDWLDRENQNGFEEILPLFAKYRVGWFNRGLRRDTSDGIQRTHVFDRDGNPINERDIALIQAFKFEDAAPTAE